MFNLHNDKFTRIFAPLNQHYGQTQAILKLLNSHNWAAANDDVNPLCLGQYSNKNL